MAGQLPVAGISWLDAIEFCNALSSRHGFPEFYRISGDVVTIRGGIGFRLPTEAEWEFACRAGTTSRWSFGSDSAKLTEHGWFARNAHGKFQRGGQLRPNAWGLFDMHGNVPEWCWDRFDPDYYQHAVRVNPSGSTRGLQRVFRGGSASDTPEQTTSSSRNPLGVSYGGFLNPVGLRVARDAS